MKNSLKLILSLAGIALVATPLVQAQSESRPPAGERRPGGPGGGGRGMNAEMLTERLGLSAEQAGKVREIFKKQQEQMQALSPEERQEKGRALRQETMKAVEAVLTAEQKQKLQELRASGPQGGPGGPGERRRAKDGPGG